MNQVDFFGGGSTARPFKDIRNTRPSAAEEKAQLVLILGRLCATCPPRVRNGSVNITRRWIAEQKKALSVAGNGRSSVTDLGLAIKSMRSFEEQT